MRHPCGFDDAGAILGVISLVITLGPIGIGPTFVGIRSAAAAQPANDDRPRFANPSNWNFTRTSASGAAQKGAFRVEDGLIFHLDMDEAVGRAFQDEQGLLHLEFVGHRKIAQGEAVVEKVRDGRWHGTLLFDGEEWDFDMRRR